MHAWECFGFLFLSYRGDVLSPSLMTFLQEHYDLSLCGLFYGPSVVYTGQEERRKQRCVHLRQSEATAKVQPPSVCSEANGRMKCFL